MQLAKLFVVALALGASNKSPFCGRPLKFRIRKEGRTENECSNLPAGAKNNHCQTGG